MNELLEYFKPSEHLSYLGYIVRTLVSLLFIYAMTRFLKKRAAGQITSFDFVFLWMLGALSVAPLLDGKVIFSTTVLSTATLFLWHFLVSFIRIKSRSLSRILTGEPLVLVENGIIHEKNMRHAFFNNELLLSELRLIHCFDLGELKQVILETNGHLSIIKKSIHSIPTQQDFQIQIHPSIMPTILINNGKLLYSNLESLNLTKKWLVDELLRKGISDIKSVYLATINSSGEIYYSLKNK